jgi:hypothetical protein
VPVRTCPIIAISIFRGVKTHGASRAFAACAVLGAALAPLAASADPSDADALRTQLVQPANEAIAAKLQAERAAKQMAQANPVGTPHRPLRRPGLPGGFSYNVDLSIAAPTSDPGFNTTDPGGLDAGVGYGFSPENRFQAGYYEVQQVPLGFANKTVPFYVQGLTGPGTTVPQATSYANTGNVNITTKDKILTLLDQNLILLGGKLPVVISPTYLSHTANVGGYGDKELVEFDGFPTVVHTRTEQEYILPVTIPLLATPRFFGTITAASQWLVHPAGVNQTNHPQFFGLAYLEFRASRSTTFFVQPSRLVQYDPDDPYPQYTPTIVYGLSHHFTKRTYVQITALEGGATNYPLGITALTCQRLPCGPAQVAPSIGGLKASEVQVQFGVGSPTVIPL